MLENKKARPGWLPGAGRDLSVRNHSTVYAHRARAQDFVGRIDRGIIDTIRAVAISEIIGRRVPLIPCGREFVAHCLFHQDRTPSFTVSDDKGFFHCFGCGAHGDAIDFTMRTDHLSFPEVVEALAIEVGLRPGRDGMLPVIRPSPRAASPAVERAKVKRIERAAHIYRTAQSGAAPGSLVSTYLASRGITTLSPVLRFVPALNYWHEQDDGPPKFLGRFPAMVAPVQDLHGRVIGCHRTYLRADGRGKADVPKPKKLLGYMAAGTIRLTPAAETLALAEGIENGLTALQSLPDLAAWAAISLSNLPRIELPPVVQKVVLLADSDNTDEARAEALLVHAARRFALQGRRVRIARPPTGQDLNDVLQACVTARRAA